MDSPLFPCRRLTKIRKLPQPLKPLRARHRHRQNRKLSNLLRRRPTMSSPNRLTPPRCRSRPHLLLMLLTRHGHLCLTFGTPETSWLQARPHQSNSPLTHGDCWKQKSLLISNPCCSVTRTKRSLRPITSRLFGTLCQVSQRQPRQLTHWFGNSRCNGHWSLTTPPSLSMPDR